jgi:hypothetical protein
MGGGAGFGGFGQQQGGFGGQQQGGFGGQQQNPSSGVGGFGRPQGGFNNRQGGFGQQAGFNGFNPQQQFQNPYGPPQMQQMYTPYSQMDQNQFGFQQPQAFRDYQQQQQARMFQNPYQQNPYQQQFGRQGGFGFGQQPQYTQHPQQQLLQRMGVIPGQPEQQLPQQAQQTEQPTGDTFASPAVMPQEGTPEYQQRMLENNRRVMQQTPQERQRIQQELMFNPLNGNQQPRGMTMDMPQYGRDPFQSMGGLGSLGNLFNRYGTQRGQQTAPPGMERRMGMGGEYFVPAGTQYNPFMD